MSFVVPLRVNDQVVDKFYKRVSTEGDSAGLTAEAEGRRAVVVWSDGVVSPDGTELTMTVPFNFLLNRNQLEVYWELNSLNSFPGSVSGWARMIDKSLALQIPTFNLEEHPYYEEITSNTIIVHNPSNLGPQPFLNNDPNQSGGTGDNNSFLFSVPHTSLPATSTNRIIVENQGDNVGVELIGRGDGILFTTTSGGHVLLRPDEGNGMTVTPV